MYAIIVTGGKQYKVSEGDILFIEKKVEALGWSHLQSQSQDLNPGLLDSGPSPSCLCSAELPKIGKYSVAFA